MVKDLLTRGMLAGVIAALLAFAFAEVFGEPQINRAIDLEGQIAAARGEPAEPELVSRGIQSTIGLLTGIAVYGAAIGGIYALLFALAYGRVGSVGARGTAFLVAACGFVTIALAPGLKYPANPPAVGLEETLALRTGLYFSMVALSVAAVAAGLVTWRRLTGRLGSWNAALGAMGVFLTLVAAAGFLLPGIDEVAAEFPATLLWKFRIASLGMQFILWSALGIVFGVFAEAVLRRHAPAAMPGSTRRAEALR